MIKLVTTGLNQMPALRLYSEQENTWINRLQDSTLRPTRGYILKLTGLHEQPERYDGLKGELQGFDGYMPSNWIKLLHTDYNSTLMFVRPVCCLTRCLKIFSLTETSGMLCKALNPWHKQVLDHVYTACIASSRPYTVFDTSIKKPPMAGGFLSANW